MALKKQKLRVWWIPQVPMAPFYVEVSTPKEGAKVIHTLAEYDLFQVKHGVRPDYNNVGGLQVFEDGAWHEWEDSKGREIGSILP